MSDDVHSKGYFGKLKEPVGDHTTEKWDTLNDFLNSHDMHLNYDGTMIYSDKQSNTYDCGLIFADPNGAIVFREKCRELGYDVDPVKHYTCIWYNGSDSLMATATVEEVFP